MPSSSWFTFRLPLMPMPRVTSSVQSLPEYIQTRLQPSLVISTTLLSLVIYQLFPNLSAAQLRKTRKHWTYFMETSMIHTTPSPYPYSGTPTTIWCFSSVSTSPLLNSNTLEPELCETHKSLQVCFEATHWDILWDPHGQDINTMTHCITEYINFCVDTIIASRTVKCFPNNKPWITTNLLKKREKSLQE